jgi:WD40 repeat protein
MSDVFVSYSRRDKPFVQRLHAALAEQKRDVWVDWEDIPATADWWKEIQNGIDAANTFVFIITHDSLASDVCRREIEHAVSSNKRFVPILHRQPTQEEISALNVHPAVNSHNWVYFREEDNFNQAFKTLLEALDTDLSYVRDHTRLLVRAREWERSGAGLLTGAEHRAAEAWLTSAVGKQPAPTELHTRYLLASRAAERRRQRIVLLGVSLAFVVAIALAIFGLTQSRIASSNASTAQVRVTEVAQQAATAQAAQGTAVFEANRAEANARTADANFVLAQSNLLTAQAAQSTAVFEADANATAQAVAQREADANATAQANAQEEADQRATAQFIAVTAQIAAEFNLARAQNNAATATVAQGEALIQASTAQAAADANATAQSIAQREADANATAQAIAQQEADANATAQAVAQGEADQRATQQSIALTAQFDAQNSAATAVFNANANATAQSIAQREADANATAQAIAQGEANQRATQQSIALTAQFDAQNSAATAVFNANANATAQAIAVTQAAIATVAQGEALFQAATAQAAADANATAQAIAQREADSNATAQAVAQAAADANATAQWVAQGEADQRATQEGIALTAQYEAQNSAATAVSEANANATAQAIAQREADANATAQYEAQNSAATAVFNANANATAQAIAQREADANATAQAVAQNSAVTAVAAQETAIFNEQQARAQALASSGEQLLDAGNPDIAIALALEASELNPSLTQAQRLLNRASLFSSRLNLTRAQRQETETFRDNLGRDRTRTITISALGGLFSPDAQYFVLSPDGPTLHVYRTADRALLYQLTSHTSWVSAAVFSPDSRYLISGNESGLINLWDMTNGALVRQFDGHSARINALACSPTEEKFVSASADRSAILWNRDTGAAEVTLTGFGASVERVFFTENGEQAQAYAPNQDQPRLGRLPAPDPNRPFSNLSAKYRGFSPNGRYAYSGGDETGYLVLWNADRGTQAREFRLGVAREDYILQVAFSPDGRYVAAHSEGRAYQDQDTYRVTRRSVELWRIDTGELARNDVFDGSYEFDGFGTIDFDNPTGWDIFSLAFSPDSRTMLVGGRFDRISALYLLDVQTGEILRRYTGHNRPISETNFSDDGTYAYSVAEGNVRLWDISERETSQIGAVDTGGGPIINVGISPNAEVVYGQNRGAGVIGAWNLLNNERVITPINIGSSPLAFSPTDPTVLVAGSTANISRNANTGVYDERVDKLVIPDFSSLTVYDLNSGVFTQQSSVRLHVVTLNYGADGRTVVMGGYLPVFAGDGSAASDTYFIYVWDIQTQEIIQAINMPDDMTTAPITHVAISPDGAYLASTSETTDGTYTVIIWSSADGSPLHRLSGVNSPVTALSFDPTGRTVVTALDEPEKTVLVWDVATGDQLLALIGHADAILALAFSPDGETMLTGSADQTLILWDMTNGEPLRRFTGHDGAVNSVAFSRDGRLAVSSATGSEILVWRIETLQDTVNWIRNNRALIELTCPQRGQYNVKPLCEDGVVPTLTPTGTLLPTLTPTITPTPTETPIPSATPVPTAVIRTTDGSAANLRTGPGPGFRAIGVVTSGTTVIVVDAVSEPFWIQIQLMDGSGSIGWVTRGVVEFR